MDELATDIHLELDKTIDGYHTFEYYYKEDEDGSNPITVVMYISYDSKWDHYSISYNKEVPEVIKDLVETEVYKKIDSLLPPEVDCC